MRSGSSFGFLGMFGRSSDLRQLDAALRLVGLHRAVVPEGVKLALVNLIKDSHGNEPPADSYAPAAAMLSYCMLGAEGFVAANGDEALDVIVARVDSAGETGEGLDAGIVLLAHHAGIIQPSVVERHGLDIAQD